MGDRERIGDEIVIGYLTTATVLVPDSTYLDEGGGRLHADAEVALELARDLEPDVGPEEASASVNTFAVALEIVDLASPPEDAESIVGSNVFHRAVTFGPHHARPTFPIEGRLEVNGLVRESSTSVPDLSERLSAAARVLGGMGEQLRQGDRVITGSVVQVPVAPGDEVVADMGELGRVRLHIVGRP